MVNLADNKFGDLTKTQIDGHLVLADWPRIAKDTSTIPSQNNIGGDFSLAVEEKFAKLPN